MENLIKYKTVWWWVLAWIVILVGMILRVHEADSYPVYYNEDGLFYVWAGNSILDDFTKPTSLSIFDADNPYLIWRSQFMNLVPLMRFGYRLVEPWFDAPFLSTILIALPARFFGYTQFTLVPQMLVRLPALFASMLTMYLLYYLGMLLFSRGVGLVSLLFYAFWPLAAFSNRLSYLENFIVVYWLTSLLCVWHYTKSLERKYLWGMILSGVLAALSKVTGLGVFLTSLVWLLWNKKFAAARSVGISLLATIGLYLLYGFVVGGDAFSMLMTNQADRGSYVSSFFYIFTTPEVFGLLQDGWWFIGLASSFWLFSKKDKSAAFISMNLLLWWVVVFMTSGVQNTSPWYRNPWFPLMALAAGKMTHAWLTRSSLTGTIIWILFGLTGWNLAHIAVSETGLRVFVLVLVGLVVMERIGIKNPLLRKVTRLGMLALFVTSVLGNAVAIWVYPSLFCSEHECVAPRKIDVMESNI